MLLPFLRKKSEWSKIEREYTASVKANLSMVQQPRQARQKKVPERDKNQKIYSSLKR